MECTETEDCKGCLYEARKKDQKVAAKEKAKAKEEAKEQAKNKKREMAGKPKEHKLRYGLRMVCPGWKCKICHEEEKAG